MCKELIVRVCGLRVVRTGSGSSSSASSSSSSCLTAEVGFSCEASRTPRLPILSPAKIKGLASDGWNVIV